ncbi:caspase family protein [Piscinibacter gummiphilus]|uniref:Caspase family protein n=1 Tax=Piscinibacter gummiphilus TaxID=946333 RepID=A0ABZ0CX25_9BURK|nr:caspase family protein [Piscinibacter gummiphilus]WOB09514.1 caspase family protein [Piscinibacter gummiphilus]
MRLFQFMALAVLAAGLLGGCASPSPKADKVALVIGNAGYDNVVKLVNPTNDAADMFTSLKKLGFKATCATDVRDRAEFDQLVKAYVATLDAGAVGVFYYSGHGVQAGHGNYLIPTQVQLKSAAEDPTRVLYAVDDLFDRLRQRRARFQLVVLDACRADLFAQAEHKPGSRSAAAPRSNLVRALETVARASNGLAPIKDAPPGTMVLYATASKDLAFDGDGRNGPLTKHILEHIETRGIYVEEFIKRVTLGVEQETLRKYRKRQTPFIYGSFSGKFCFAGCPGDHDVPVPPAF